MHRTKLSRTTEYKGAESLQQPHTSLHLQGRLIVESSLAALPGFLTNSHPRDSRFSHTPTHKKQKQKKKKKVKSENKKDRGKGREKEGFPEFLAAGGGALQFKLYLPARTKRDTPRYDTPDFLFPQVLCFFPSPRNRSTERERHKTGSLRKGPVCFFHSAAAIS